VAAKKGGKVLKDTKKAMDFVEKSGWTEAGIARKKPGQQIILFLFKRGNKLQIGNWKDVLYEVLKRTTDGKKVHIWFRDHVGHYWHGIEKGMGMFVCRRLKYKPGWIKE